VWPSRASSRSQTPSPSPRVSAVCTGARLADTVARGVTGSLLALVLSVLFAVAGFVAWSAAPAFVSISGVGDLLAAAPWAPMSDPPRFGLRHALVSTVWVTGIALAIAVPLGLGTAAFVSEVAPRRVRVLVPPLLELLAGVPSVVYGFVGYVTLVAWSERLFDVPAGESLLVAGVVLAVMVLPFVGSTAIEVFRAVPADMRESAFGLGVSRWHVISRVLAPRAAPALFGGVALAFARAAGETLAVLMLAGNSTRLPHTPLDRGQPLTALIATELGEAGVGSPKSHALMAAGLLLFALVVVLNASIWTLKRRLVADAA
jgi:phosphate transport system permease protein